MPITSQLSSFYMNKYSTKLYFQNVFLWFIRNNLKGHLIIHFLGCVALSCSGICHSLRPHGLYSMSGSSVYGDSPGKTTGGGCHALLQEIFPTQRSIPGLPHWGHFLYHLNHQGNSRILEWVPYPFSRGIFPTQELNLVFCIAGRFYILFKVLLKKIW